MSYETSEEGGSSSCDGKTDDGTRNATLIPLIHISLSQPNMYLSCKYVDQHLQVSCFDIAIKLSDDDFDDDVVTDYDSSNRRRKRRRRITARLPIEADYPINLIETRAGKSNPTTGIPPAFFTLKLTKIYHQHYHKNNNNTISLNVDIARPTKICYSRLKWMYLLMIKRKIVDSFDLLLTMTNSLVNDNNIDKSIGIFDNNYQCIKEKFYRINTIDIGFDQIVFVMKIDDDDDDTPEIIFNIDKINSKLNFIDRPEKISNITTFNSITLSIKDNLSSKLILNPLTITVDICLYWDSSWQSITDNNNQQLNRPQIRFAIDSDCLIINIIPQQIRCVEKIFNELIEFVQLSSSLSSDNVDATIDDEMKSSSNFDQYYKDDLRAGAFQFVDSQTNNVDELPLPYQVMFWNNRQLLSAMAWRYPQPRALTKVRVFPVPFKMTSNNTTDDDDDFDDCTMQQQVLCHLEYWSECHTCYLPYTQFYLSENDVCHLNLPKGDPQPAVACIWRVVLTTTINRHDNDNKMIALSPRALAACMRIDSYFNQSLIPDLLIAGYLAKITINLYSHFDNDNELSSIILPDTIKQYVPDMLFPTTQCFLTLSIDNFHSYLISWNQSKQLSLDIDMTSKCTVLDYKYLTEQIFIDTFSSRIELSIMKYDRIKLNFSTKQTIQFKFNPNIAHSLAISGQLWTKQSNDFILLTRYIICNNTNINLRFGQYNTDENMLLPSKYFHMYSWRTQKSHTQLLKLAVFIDSDNEWLWSKPFHIDDANRTEIVRLKPDLMLIVKVDAISSTQLQITISGQLIVSNMLLEQFEFKIVDNNSESGTAAAGSTRKSTPPHIVHILGGKTTTPSMLIDSRKSYFMRLRFFGLESAWTGDIPLKEHTKGSQPWLVKGKRENYFYKTGVVSQFSFLPS